MAVVIKGPDGAQISFPDGTDEGTITKAMAQAYPSPNQPSFKDQAIDAVRSIPGGVAKGVAGIVGIPGDMADLANKGMDYLTGADVAKRNPSRITTTNVGHALSAPFGGFYQPQTTPGKYAETIAGFAPAAVGGEASLAARAARMALPGIGSEVAGQATQGTPYEPYARAAGGLFGAGLPLAARGAMNVAGYVAPRVLGATTGVGTRAVQEAYRAGSQGGSAADAFTGALRSETPSSDPVSMARAALGDLRAERGAAYRSDMGAMAQDNHILDFAPIDAEIAKLDAVKNFKGVDISPSTAGVRAQIKDAVDTWKALPPADFHTPEGFDALKQQIGDIRDAAPFGSPERVVANGAYSAVKGAIVKQSPGYAKTMGDYSKASEQLGELQSELSLKPNANPNTTLRKLQSIMRDNVNTGWGKRQALGDILAQKQPDLMPTLAGQALSKPVAHGILGQTTLPMAALGLGLTHPGALPGLALMSPRLVGEASHAAGATARALRPAIKPLERGYRAGLFGSIPLSLSPMLAQ